MKLTKDKLRQIIKEELEELMSVKEVGSWKTKPLVHVGIGEVPDDRYVPPPSSKTQNISGPPPLAKEIFSLQSNDPKIDNDPKMVASINTLGNFISSLEKNSKLDFDKSKVEKQGGLKTLLVRIDKPEFGKPELRDKIEKFLQSKNIQI